MRTFKRVVKFGYLVLVFIILFSCKKNENKNSREEQKIAFEQLANFHNEGLQYVGQFGPSNLTQKQRYYLVDEFLGINPDWTNDSIFISQINQICGNGDISFLFIGQNRSTNNIDPDLKNILSKIDTLFDEMLYKAENNIETSPTEFNYKVDQLIDFIYENYNVQYDEKTNKANKYGVVVASLFLAKFTYAYWYEAATDPNHPWYDYMHSNAERNLFLRSIWRAIRAAARDVWGFLTGVALCEPSDNNFICIDLGAMISNAIEASAS